MKITEFNLAEFEISQISQIHQTSDIRHQRYCTKLMIYDEDDYECRLAKLKLDELNIHLQFLCLRYVMLVSSNDEHPCHSFLINDHRKFNRTALLDNNVFNKFT